MTNSPTNNGAEALMALNSSADGRLVNAIDTNSSNGMCLAKLTGSDFEYFMRKDKAVIGRNSSHGQVDVSIGLSSYVSRRHLQIFRERNRYFLQCLGKNGVFVDGQFQRLGGDPLPLKPTCTIRFPSTNIRVQFTLVKSSEAENQNESNGKIHEENEKTENIEQSIKNEIVEESMVLEPVAVSAEDKKTPVIMREPSLPYTNPYLNKSYFSAPPSPTGTISAANSCPASPRGGTSHLNITDNLKMAAAFAAKVVQERGENVEQATGGISDSPPRDDQKPPYSYAQLIIQAISSSKNKHLTLSGIYAHITKHYPYYRTADKGWQNSIRHNLSLNRYFVKVPRSQEESGKGSFWRIDPASEHKLVDQAWRKRRQRGVPCFRAPLSNISTRSAPSSPIHSNPMSPQPQIHGQESVALSQGATSQTLPQVPVQVYDKEQKVQFVQVPRYAQSAPGSPATLTTAIMTTGAASITHPLATNQQQTPSMINPQPVPIVTPVGKVMWPIDVTKPQVGIPGTSIIKPANGNGVINSESVIRATNISEPQKLSLVMPTTQQLVMVAGQRPSTQSYPVSLGTIVTATQMSLAQPGTIHSAPIIMKRQLSAPPINEAEEVKRMKIQTDVSQGSIKEEST